MDIHTSTDRRLDYIQLEAAMNNGTMNIAYMLYRVELLFMFNFHVKFMFNF